MNERIQGFEDSRVQVFVFTKFLQALLLLQSWITNKKGFIAIKMCDICFFACYAKDSHYETKSLNNI